jgi:hypothetical protein
MNFVSVYLGMLIILSVSICVLFYSSTYIALKIIIFAFLIILLIIIAVGALTNKAGLKMHAIFLSYATRVIK